MVVLHGYVERGPLFGEPLVPGYEGLTGTITLSGVGVGTFESVYV